MRGGGGERLEAPRVRPLTAALAAPSPATRAARRLAIVVIGTTEGVNVAEVTAALDAGACEFLSKPLVRSVVSNLWTHAWRKQREVAKDEGGVRAGLGAAGPAAGAPTGNGAPPANDDSENTHEDAAAGATAAAGNAAARGAKLAVSSGAGGVLGNGHAARAEGAGAGSRSGARRAGSRSGRRRKSGSGADGGGSGTSIGTGDASGAGMAAVRAAAAAAAAAAAHAQGHAAALAAMGSVLPHMAANGAHVPPHRPPARAIGSHSAFSAFSAPRVALFGGARSGATSSASVLQAPGGGSATPGSTSGSGEAGGVAGSQAMTAQAHAGFAAAQAQAAHANAGHAFVQWGAGGMGAGSIPPGVASAAAVAAVGSEDPNMQPAAHMRRQAMQMARSEAAAGTDGWRPALEGPANDAGGVATTDTVAAARRVRLEALRKYREKKKTRSFNKKVRYESRKRVAMNRPRVLGRFVKVAGD